MQLLERHSADNIAELPAFRWSERPYLRLLCRMLTSSRHIDDVLKARLKTVGVSEYRFEMEAGSESGTQWRIIDVGGSRSQVRTLCIHTCA